MSQIVYNEEIKSYDLHTTFLRFLRNNNIYDCGNPFSNLITKFVH